MRVEYLAPVIAARFALALALLLVVAPPALAALPDIHAHRGGTVVSGKARYAEESLAAYKNAARNGFVLEVDAKLTEDGVPVAIHDATLDRTTSCSGELRTFTLAELAACRTDVLGSPGSSLPTRRASRPAPIITIRSLLEFAKRAGAEVNLEIKNVPTDPDFDSTPAYANSVMDAVRASRIPRAQLLIQSFIASNLEVARQRMPGVATSLLSVQVINEAFLQSAADNNYTFISPEWPVTADYVRRAHGLGLFVAPFTLNTAADVRGATNARVDALITDDPLMAGARARPAPAALLQRRRLHRRAPADRHRRPAHTAGRVGATGVSRHGDDARDDRQSPDAPRARPPEPQLRVPLRHAADAAAPRAAARDGPLRRQRSPAAPARGPHTRRASAAGVHSLSRPWPV